MASRPSRFLRLLARLFRWTLWLGLTAALVLQLRILSEGGFRIPSFAEDYLNRRLAAQGVTVHTDGIWLDPRGRILIKNPRVALASADIDAVPPFVSARAMALQIRRRTLLAGRVDLLRAEITGLELTLPPAQSPSGTAQSLLTGGEFRISRPTVEETWHVEQASARVLSIPTTFTCSFTGLDTGTRPASAQPIGDHVRRGLRHAADAYRNAAAFPFEPIHHLRIDLSPDRLVASAEIPSLLAPAHPAMPDIAVGATLRGARIATGLAFGDPERDELRIDADSLSAATIKSGPLSIRLRRDATGTLFADLAAASIQKKDTHLPAIPLVASASHSMAEGRLAGEASVLLADAPWGLEFDGSPATRAGRVSAQGELTPALLDLVRPFLPEKARPVLQLTDPVRIAASADIAPGGIPELVLARASAGRAVAHDVRFDRAGSILRYEPLAARFRADELLLVQDDSLALGSYEMDTKSLAFRFLLGGRLRPMGIDGWFSDWWENFWDDFAFGDRPPDAEVDIQGVWREPYRTTVFVSASSLPMTLRQLPLETLTTRLFVADGLVDVLGFHATRGEHVADGRFTWRTLPSNGDWTSLAFDIRSDFPLNALPALFPEQAEDIVAPLALQNPPAIHIAGEVHGPGAGELAGRQRYTLTASTEKPLRYHDFPLDHLALRLERRDEEIRIDNLRAGVATGLATGNLVLSGPENSRWLALDIGLFEADVDQTIRQWREFQAARTTEKTTAGPDKSPGGKLDLMLAATGPADQPLRFSGQGKARITGADLASIRLLGRFSELLSGLGIGLTTLKLTDAEARFTLDRDRLRFAPLNLSGPSALIESEGIYRLTDGILDFKARVRPFEKREGILSSTVGFVLTPLSSALEVDLDGTLEHPDWTFSYGPTQLFRRITGSRGKSDASANSPSESPRETDANH